MRIKVVTPNKEGKIELTPGELQIMLNEAYDQGWRDRVNYNYGYSISTTTLNNSDTVDCAADTALAASSHCITNVEVVK